MLGQQPPMMPPPMTQPGAPQQPMMQPPMMQPPMMQQPRALLPASGTLLAVAGADGFCNLWRGDDWSAPKSIQRLAHEGDQVYGCAWASCGDAYGAWLLTAAGAARRLNHLQGHVAPTPGDVVVLPSHLRETELRARGGVHFNVTLVGDTWVAGLGVEQVEVRGVRGD